MKILLFLIAFPVCFFFSCSDDEGPDTSAPEITIVSPHEDARVNGTVTIDIKAEDRAKEVSLELFFDGNLLKKETTKEIIADVDTKALSEGKHEIKIVATDNAGNTVSKSFNVEVRNILFTVQVPSNYVEDYTEVTFLISRNDGSLLFHKKIVNGETITVPTPVDFNADSSFVFTEFFHLDQPISETNLVRVLVNSPNIYAGMYAGNYSLAGGDKIVTVGTHHLTVTDVPESHVASINGRNTTSIYGDFGPSGLIDRDVAMFKPASDLYFTLTPLPAGEPVYNYLPSVTAGESTSFSYNDMKSMDKQKISLTSPALQYYVYIYGPRGNDLQDLEVFKSSSTSATSEIPYFLPGSSFSEYLYNVQFDLEGGTHGIYSHSNTPLTSIQTLNTTVSKSTYSNRKLSITGTGAYDVASVSAGRNSFTQDFYKLETFYLHLPYGISSVVVPQFPEEVLAYEMYSAEEAEFSFASFSDYDGISGIADYQNKIVFSSDNISRYQRDRLYKTIPITMSAGRRAAQSRMHELPANLRWLRNRLPDL